MGNLLSQLHLLRSRQKDSARKNSPSAEILNDDIATASHPIRIIHKLVFVMGRIISDVMRILFSISALKLKLSKVREIMQSLRIARISST